MSNRVGGNGNDNMVDTGVIGKSQDGTHQSRDAGQQVVLFGMIEIHSGAETGSRNDDGD
jgi:hypothetical protein